MFVYIVGENFLSVECPSFTDTVNIVNQSLFSTTLFTERAGFFGIFSFMIFPFLNIFTK